MRTFCYYFFPRPAFATILHRFRVTMNDCAGPVTSIRHPIIPSLLARLFTRYLQISISLSTRQRRNVFSILVKLAIDYDIQAKSRNIAKIKTRKIIIAKYQNMFALHNFDLLSYLDFFRFWLLCDCFCALNEAVLNFSGKYLCTHFMRIKLIEEKY